MYAAKGTKGWYAVYEPQQDEHTPSRLALMGELRHAIDHDELILHYQPKMDLKTGRAVSVEALVRWQHPQRGSIPPAEFIPLAERTTLMTPLTVWVLNEALRQCRVWRDQGLDIRVQVNLSARMRDPRLIDMIAEILRTWGAAPDWLGVEITEGAIMTDPERALEILSRLKEMGVFICIDDFGTGYSSLAYLQRLPVEEIKIDRSFVKDMVRNSSDCSIVQATVSLVHDLGKRTVAEGVEDQETRDLLIELGCDLAQGYYLGRPLPADETTDWLREHREDS
jgi:EAL domain-containing protein (putative c-di-GMP-specific phosphodiesterase class I)